MSTRYTFSNLKTKFTYKSGLAPDFVYSCSSISPKYLIETADKYNTIKIEPKQVYVFENLPQKIGYLSDKDLKISPQYNQQCLWNLIESLIKGIFCRFEGRFIVYEEEYEDNECEHRVGRSTEGCKTGHGRIYMEWI